MLWVIRISILGVGIISTVLALNVQSIYVLFHLCSDLVYAILFPQLFCVVYIDASNTYGSISGYFVGLFFRIAGGEPLIGFDALIKYPFYDEEYGQLFPFRTFAMICSFSTIIAVSYASRYLLMNKVIPIECDILNCFKHEFAPREHDHDGNSVKLVETVKL